MGKEKKVYRWKTESILINSTEFWRENAGTRGRRGISHHERKTIWQVCKKNYTYKLHALNWRSDSTMTLKKFCESNKNFSSKHEALFEIYSKFIYLCWRLLSLSFYILLNENYCLKASIETKLTNYRVMDACINLNLNLLVRKLNINSKKSFPAFLITQIDQFSRAASSTDGRRKHWKNLKRSSKLKRRRNRRKSLASESQAVKRFSLYRDQFLVLCFLPAIF